MAAYHPWAEDIDVDVAPELGTPEEPAPIDLVLDPDGRFLTHRARILFELFPTLDTLTLYIYNASGWKRTHP